jgi:hypothetical protein
MPRQRKPNDLSRSLTALDMDTTLIAVVELSVGTLRAFGLEAKLAVESWR